MPSKKDNQDRGLSLKRAQVIIKVQAKQMTATDGAAELNVSRKTYYEWENKALESMVEALTNGSPGRPRKEVDEEKDAMKKRIEELEAKLKSHEVALRVRETLAPVTPDREIPSATGSTQVRRKTAVKKKEQQKR